jgi:hypothetical protein
VETGVKMEMVAGPGPVRTQSVDVSLGEMRSAGVSKQGSSITCTGIGGGMGHLQAIKSNRLVGE